MKRGPYYPPECYLRRCWCYHRQHLRIELLVIRPTTAEVVGHKTNKAEKKGFKNLLNDEKSPHLTECFQNKA